MATYQGVRVNAKQAAKGSIVVARKGITIAQKAAHVSIANMPPLVSIESLDDLKAYMKVMTATAMTSHE